jgi:hypothetical protein
VRFKEPLPSYARQSWNPLRRRFKEPREEETDSDEDMVIGWAEDQYKLPPREEPCEFCFPEDIVVPRLPGSEAEEAGNQEEGLQAQEGPEDSEGGEEVYQVEFPPGLNTAHQRRPEA